MSDEKNNPEEEEDDETGSGEDAGSGSDIEQVEDVGVLARQVEDHILTEQWKINVQAASSVIFSDFVGPLGQVSEKEFSTIMSRMRNLQKNLLKNSKFVFHPLIHRHSNIIPFDENAMRDHIGSWVGSGIGMMQWPVAGNKYTEILQKVILENDVGVIVALGPQDPNDRTKMIPYWETLGSCEPIATSPNCVPGDEAYKVQLGSANIFVLRLINWEDFDVPTPEQVVRFEAVFRFLQRTQADNKRIIFHCRAGVGRSGTFYLMYNAFRGFVTPANALRHWVSLRHARVETIQTVHQLNFALNYVMACAAATSFSGRPPLEACPSMQRLPSEMRKPELDMNGLDFTSHKGVIAELPRFDAKPVCDAPSSLLECLEEELSERESALSQLCRLMAFVEGSYD